MPIVRALLGALVLLAGSVLAQTPPAVSEPVVVTATRTPRTVDETLASISVITRSDIERRQPQDLVDLLRTQAGVDITRAGGPGGNISLFLRGANSNHVLVLIDGVRVASATTGTFEWRNFPVALIERIEIVRGPRATLYGSDAIGGVIHIFTRRPRGIEAAAGMASEETRRAELAVGTGERLQMHIAATHDETQGFSAQNEKGFSFDPDDDGFRRQTVSAGLGTPLGARARLELSGWRSSGRTEFDIGESDLTNEMANARLTGTMSPRWTQSLNLGYATDDLTTHSAFASRFTTRRRMAEWQNDLTLAAQTVLSAGLSYKRDAGENIDRVAMTTVYDRAQRDRAAFALLQTRVSDTDVQLGTRYDDYSTFGAHTTGSLALGRSLTSGIRGFASYGTAFRAPTLNDLYHPGTFGLFAGNPALDPERSRTAEIGLRMQVHPGESVRLSIFNTRIEDLIAFEGVNFQAVNVAKASVRGLELEHERVAGPWAWSTAITLQRPRDELTDEELLLRPNTKLAAFLERRFGWGSAGAEWIVVSERRDFVGDLPGYGLVNLAARYVWTKTLGMEVRVENAFDKDYELIEGFNTPDRSLFVALRYRSE